MDKLRCLDLFSGIGGMAYGLSPYLKTVTYCEIEKHAQAVLFSRMQSNDLDHAPVWDDIRSLSLAVLRDSGIVNGTDNIDIITAGFPCQDISAAGRGRGLAGERSGLFFEIMRLAEEIRPLFIFLENVAAIRTRGMDRVIEELTEAGYDVRYKFLSASDIGAPHKRERWFCLARRRMPYAHVQPLQSISRSMGSSPDKAFEQEWRDVPDSVGADVSDSDGELLRNKQRVESESKAIAGDYGSKEPVANAYKRGLPPTWAWLTTAGLARSGIQTASHWAAEPDVGRVVDGLSLRVDRIKRLGNSVVPQCARQAFEDLLGVTALRQYPLMAFDNEESALQCREW